MAPMNEKTPLDEERIWTKVTYCEVHERGDVMFVRDEAQHIYALHLPTQTGFEVEYSDIGMIKWAAVTPGEKGGDRIAYRNPDDHAFRSMPELLDWARETIEDHAGESDE